MTQQNYFEVTKEGVVVCPVIADEGAEKDDPSLIPVRTHEGVETGYTWDGSNFNPPSAEDRRNAWATTAHLSRGDFCAAVAAAGIVPTSEAIEAAKGNWPASFQPFLSAMSSQEQVAAQIKWAAAATVDRLDPLLGYLQQAANLTESQVDALFGYAP